LQAARPESSALQILDTTTNAIVKALIAEQSASGVPGGSMTLSIPVEGSKPVSLKLGLPGRNITLPELQRHKRQFVNVHKKAVTLGSTEKGAVAFDEASVAEKFGDYLEENVK
jgi:protein KTI12